MLRTILALPIRTLLDLLYPPRCAGCGDFAGVWWCTSCEARVHWFNSTDTVRTAELPDYPSLTVVSAAHFESPLREAIHALKYEGVPHVASLFGARMAHAWQASSVSFAPTMLVPVPLHPRRERERGYNQSMLLARVVAGVLGLPVERRAVRRTRRTEKQAQLESHLEVRLANVKGAFTAAPPIVRGQRILLVDDVFTTGATLLTCAAALHAAGAADVAALTLARTRK